MNTVIKLPQNTVLGSISKVDNVENVQSSYSLKHYNVKADADSHPSKPLLPAFPDSSSFTTHAHNSDKSPIQLQDASVPSEIQHQLNTMLTSKFADLQVSCRFWVNQPHRNGPSHYRTTSINKTLHHTFKIQSFHWWRNLTSWRCWMHFQVPQWLGISDMHCEEETRPKSTRQSTTLHVHQL